MVPNSGSSSDSSRIYVSSHCLPKKLQPITPHCRMLTDLATPLPPPPNQTEFNQIAGKKRRVFAAVDIILLIVINSGIVTFL